MAIDFNKIVEDASKNTIDQALKVGSNIVNGIIAAIVLLIILGIGYLVAKVLAAILKGFLGKIKLEEEIHAHGLNDALLGFTITDILALLLYLWVLVAFLGIGAGVVSIPYLTTLSNGLNAYIPELAKGVVVLAAGLLAGEYITNKMKSSKKMPFANMVGIIIEVFIVYNAFVIALPMLLPNANTRLLETAFTYTLGAFVLMIGLGGAIALGLGGKDAVADVLAKKKTKIDDLIK
ncbi:MAG: hypothetical protein ABIH99_00235 [Candidatus Micrarchaeota archaeon]